MNKNKSAKDKFAVQSFQIYIPEKLRKDLKRVTSESFSVESYVEASKKNNKEGKKSRKQKGGFSNSVNEEFDPLKAQNDQNNGNMSIAEIQIREDEYQKQQLNSLLKSKLADNIS
jgi:hypothetical protein